MPRPQAPGAPARDGVTPPATGTAKILGRVLSADNGSPLRRAQIRISAIEQRVTKTAMTDAEGRYSVTDLPAGRYSISVSRNGYVGLSFGQQRPFEMGKQLDLANGQVAERIDFSLPRGGVIAGRITDELGEPIAGVNVRAMRYQYQPDGQRRLTNVNMGGPFGIMTDDLGQFRVYGLMPGSYVVMATVNMNGGIAVPFPGGGMSFSGGPNDGSDGYAPTYFPGTAAEAESQSISVSIGQEASAYFSMVPAKLSRISGTVRNSQGQPMASQNLMLRTSTGYGGFSVTSGGMTGPDGTFTLQNIAPGEYSIDVRPMGRPMMQGSTPAQDVEFASVPVTVSGQDVSGLTIITGPGATISGRVIFDTTNPPPSGVGMPPQQQPRVMFQSADMGAMPGGFNSPDNGIVDAAGRFQLKGVSGRGLFRVIGVPSTVKSVTLHGVEIIDTPYEVKSSSIEGVDITLTNAQTTVTGTVRNARGEAVKDYTVVFFPNGLREGDVPTRFIRNARPDQEGAFRTRGLPPGNYFAAAVETIDQGEMFDPAFQDRMRPRAKSFRLIDGQSTTLELQLVQ